jgi:hypothetical protein
VLLLTVVLPLIPAWSILEGRLGRWSLVGRVVPSVITLIIAGIIGRRSLFGTRLNRRVFGLVALSIGAVTLNRLACAALGLSAQQTYPLDLLAVTGVAMAAGLLVHWGFFVSGFAALMGAVVGIAWPGAARVAIGGAAALGFVGVVVTWRTWRSEISAPIDWNVPPD